LAAKARTNQPTAKMNTSYAHTVMEILNIYINKAAAVHDKEEKLVYITGLMDYLSTKEVQPLLKTPTFARFRQCLRQKIREFIADPYIIQRPHVYHRLNTTMHELLASLTPRAMGCRRRRSERQQKQAVTQFNQRFQAPLAAAKLKYWLDLQAGTPLPTVSIKVLPRRSARLRAQ